MHIRRAAVAVLLVLAAATASCSSDSTNDKPGKPTATPSATSTPSVDKAAARKACVDAWAALLKEDENVSAEDEPAVCDSAPSGQKAEMYAEALRERNKANRDRLDACLQDPTCTEMPIP
jgi:hypothetical protein